MSASIQFTKMHGLGNDFVVINALNQHMDFKLFSFSALSHRHTGIGFDQLLLIEPSENADFFCRIYNADGSEAEQCGNGLRCIARYIHEEGLHPAKQFKIETRAGFFTLEIQDYDHIRVCMGAPDIINPLLPLSLVNPERDVPVSILSLGNPHAITKITSVDSPALEKLAAQISSDSHFSDGVNVGFMEILDTHKIRLRTFERGVGETFACGSNACASAAAGIMQGWLKSSVEVNFVHGFLTIEWDGKDKPIYMTGPASRVFSGELPISIK